MFTSASKKKTSLKMVFQVGALEGMLEPSAETSLLNAAMATSCVVVGGDDDRLADAPRPLSSRAKTSSQSRQEKGLITY